MTSVKFYKEIGLAILFVLCWTNVSAYAQYTAYDQAIADYTMAIKINPGYANAYNNRALVYYDKDQYDQAISDFTKAIEINPNHAQGYNSRGVAYYYKKQYNNAWDDLYKAKKIGYLDSGLLNALRKASGREE